MTLVQAQQGVSTLVNDRFWHFPVMTVVRIDVWDALESRHRRNACRLVFIHDRS